MNQKQMSSEDLQKEIKKLQKLLFLVYSKLPQESRQEIFDELNKSFDRDDLDTSSRINTYRL